MIETDDAWEIQVRARQARRRRLGLLGYGALSLFVALFLLPAYLFLTLPRKAQPVPGPDPDGHVWTLPPDNPKRACFTLTRLEYLRTEGARGEKGPVYRQMLSAWQACYQAGEPFSEQETPAYFGQPVTVWHVTQHETRYYWILPESKEHQWLFIAAFVDGRLRNFLAGVQATGAFPISQPATQAA